MQQGVLIAVLSLFYTLTLLHDLEEMAETINEYGLLWVIPAVGVGEFVIKCQSCRRRQAQQVDTYSPWGGLRVDLILITPFIILFYAYLHPLTATTYLTSALAFFADGFFGVRRGQLVFMDASSS